MRLAFIAPFALHPKGTTRWRVLPLARALAAQGHTVRVFVPPYDWPAHAGRRGQTDGVEVIHLPVGLHTSALGQVRLGYALAQAAAAWPADRVHLFKPKGPGGIAARLLLSRGCRVALDTDDYETGWNAAAGYPRLWQAFFRWQERTLLRRAAAVTAASQWLCHFVHDLGQPHCYYLPNGVDISRSQNTAQTQQLALPERNNRLRALLYSRFVEQSPQDVWAVWQRVLAHVPQAELIVAGQGGSGEVAQLRALAAAAGAGDSIKAVGWCPAAARPGLFAAVDAAFLPVQDTPLNRAKSPMRLLDLLASGVPVATQRVGEYGRYVQHAVSGLLAEPGDYAALAEQVLRLLNSPELGARLAAAAQQQMIAEQSWPKLAGQALAAYAQASGR
ncbi:MAG: glycosyltransferase [Anaerolineae bacterium]